MKQKMRDLCRVYPIRHAEALRRTVLIESQTQRLRRIDEITDSLAAEGYARKREDVRPDYRVVQE